MTFCAIRQSDRGGDLRLKVRVNLNDVANGVTKKFKVHKKIACQHCHGSGSEDGSTETCSTCKGKGYVTRVVNSMFGRMQTQSACPTCNGTGKTIKVVKTEIHNRKNQSVQDAAGDAIDAAMKKAQGK